MLEVYSGIADEGFLGGVLQNVDEGLVGEWPGFEDGFASIEVGAPGAVEAEDGTGRQTLSPKDLAVFEAGAVEFAATFVAAEPVKVSPIHCCLGRREVWDVGDWGGRVDCLRGLGFKKFGLKFPRCKMNRRKAQ